MQPHTIRTQDALAAADWLMGQAYGEVLLPLSTEGHVGWLSLGRLALWLGLSWVTWFFCSPDRPV